ncbi:MAG: hypothetical protein ACE5I1_06500, partial [bacterium]
MFNTSRLNFALPALMMALIVLAFLKFGGNIPGQLLYFNAAIFVACFVLFWVMNRAHKRSAFTQGLLLVLTWLMTTSAALAILYRWDRAGWLWFQATGYDDVLQENLSHLATLSIPQFVTQNRMFKFVPNDSTKIVIRKGNYDINKTYVVPQGTTLVIEPGTALRFRVGCSLISYSPIHAVGTEKEPIIFTSKNVWRKWGSVGIVSKERSIFEYTVFENG